MTDVRENKDDNRPKENIFRIMDGIITQLNRTKKMFIIMILTIMIIPPIAFAVSFALLGPPFPLYGGGQADRFDRFGPGFNPAFGIARIVPFLIAIVWLGIGIWQWFVLSKWTKKYERYKDLRKKTNEKLKDDDNNSNVGKEGL
jgi:hypothetical protein